jgi:GNAT superfamily N-acetyltransferase
MAFTSGAPAGFALFTARDNDMWGPNAWAEDTGNAGSGDAIRECYAALAGKLVDGGIRAHWAMVPASEADLVEGWFTVTFGLQHAYAYREPVGPEFQPRAPDGVVVRRPVEADIPALARLDLVLPAELMGSPGFSKLKPPNLEEIEAELGDDLQDAKYSFWVAEYEGKIVATLVGTDLASSSSWGPLMRPQSAGFLGYAAAFPEARGVGAGRALAETFMAWARDERFEWLVTDWRTTNLPANRTWRAMGFRPGYYRMFRAIP